MEQTLLQSLLPRFVGWHDSGEVLHTDSRQSYGRRVVEHYEIEYIVFSRSGCIVANGIPVQTIPQSVFLRRPGMEVEGIGVYRSLFVEFDLNDGADRLQALDRLTPVLFNGEELGLDESFFLGLALPVRPQPWQLLEWKAKLLHLLAVLLRQGETSSEATGQEGSAAVRRALRYIRSHYAEPVTLDQLAGAAGYSRCYFCKLFKKVTQLTPLQYLVCYRLEQAKKQMLESDEPLEVVMLEAGFHNYGYFWRAFRQIYGLSPQAFRQQMRQGPGQPPARQRGIAEDVFGCAGPGDLL